MIDGIISIRTRDLGDQLYLIKMEPDSSNFLPGQRTVSKVEPVRSKHEEIMYRKANWRIYTNLRTGDCYAHRAFAVLKDGVATPFRHLRNEHAERESIERLLIRGVADADIAASDANAFVASSTMLWQQHARIVTDFLAAHEKALQ